MHIDLQCLHDQWPQKDEVQWGKYRWEVGHRVVRVQITQRGEKK
jgi:hypothetical protein